MTTESAPASAMSPDVLDQRAAEVSETCAAMWNESPAARLISRTNCVRCRSGMKPPSPQVPPTNKPDTPNLACCSTSRAMLRSSKEPSFWNGVGVADQINRRYGLPRSACIYLLRLTILNKKLNLNKADHLAETSDRSKPKTVTWVNYRSDQSPWQVPDCRTEWQPPASSSRCTFAGCTARADPPP